MMSCVQEGKFYPDSLHETSHLAFRPHGAETTVSSSQYVVVGPFRSVRPVRDTARSSTPLNSGTWILAGM